MGLKTYLQNRFSYISGSLSWADAIYDYIVEDSLELYGVNTEAEATDVAKFHILGVYSFWKTVLTYLTLDMDFSADGSSYNRSQVYEMAKKNFDLALRDMTYNINIGELDTNEDPYIYIDPDTGYGF